MFSSDKFQVHLLASLMTTSYDCSQLNFLEIPSRPGKHHNVTRLVVQICEELPINIHKDQPQGTRLLWQGFSLGLTIEFIMAPN